MIDARFIAELDRTMSHNGMMPMIYVYQTGERTDGYEYAAGLHMPNGLADGAYALFKTMDAAIAFTAGWFAMAPDMRAVLLCQSADARARHLFANRMPGC